MKKHILYIVQQELRRPEMGDRLASLDVSRKVGAAVPLFVGKLVSHLTQRQNTEANSFKLL